jgi:hypothetical protein
LYLPPLSKVVDPSVDLSDLNATKKFRIGEYAPLGPTSRTDYADFEEELLVAERNGFSRLIRFDPTSHHNRIAVQFFEIRSNDVLKLDVINFGMHTTSDLDYPRKQVYFVGKVMVDDLMNHTFIHLFTLVFE